ncbi:MAG: hypothetical protein KTR22_05485 [Flavobacteriaceae bacterium]|nr:hypothetical protein [Flavobacteriaceae bacterium]
MNIIIDSIVDDLVIDSKFITGKTDYNFGINTLYPLIDKLPIQRNLQNSSFYSRLRMDLLNGCVMPPITLALIKEKDVLPDNIKSAEKYINDNISSAFILDGIQRINALNKTYKEPALNKELDLERPLFVNIIICKSMDNLLYRMITLNNGQKPMSANHQIEILLGNIYKFNDLDIEIQTEKEKGKKGKYKHAYSKSNIIKAYLAFLTNSTAIDNKKIIDSKMDELIAKKIIDSKITEEGLEFSAIIELINRLASNEYLKKWFDNTNNIIGFSIGAKKSFNVLNEISPEAFRQSIQVFEEAFKSLNLSTIKLSKERRNLSKFFISNFENLNNQSELEILDELNEKIL